MPVQIQNKAIELIVAATGRAVGRQTPDWLQRPGRMECGDRWALIQSIYHALTGLSLPDEMPLRERRRVDAILKDGGAPRVVEVDETQHFNHHRRVTLDMYPHDVALGFDKAEWRTRADREPTPRHGKWASARPPLFPGDGGRHRQRAFRDALADILPPLRGFGPTLRISDFDVKACERSGDPVDAMRRLLVKKGFS